MAHIADAPTERRSEPRIELEVEVGMETDHNFYTGLTQDISSGGMFIATSVLYRMGDVIRVRFSLPGQAQPITADGRGALGTRSAGHEDRFSGRHRAALRGAAAEAKNEISEFLSRRDSLFYDVD